MYKNFTDKDRIRTPLHEQYIDGTPINHKMLVPIIYPDPGITQLLHNTIVIEVWDKRSPMDDELLGLVKLPLY